MRSWLSWRTVETRHFALHYPLELEDWTRTLASRLESIDSAVAEAVGFQPQQRIQIVVDDPYEASNGAALPFLNSPVITLWASPPDPEDEIGEYRSWGEMVASHEFAHMAHLLRPSRNALSRAFWSIMPVVLGPIARKSPAWVIEGYATYVEGKVTGLGRPHGVWGPALIRQLALEGRLPTYAGLDTSRAFEGSAYRYLIGSAFLEWLTRRPNQNDSSLVHLWRRLSARQNRGFDEAFIGVFGESPAILYGRFVVDATENAGQVRETLSQAGLDTGAIVQRLAWRTGSPAISKDGKWVAVPLAARGSPGRLVVWSTAPESDSARRAQDRALIGADSQDVAPIHLYPPAKKSKATLPAVAGLSYRDPRFLSDGRVLVWRSTDLGDGALGSDLYIWNWERGGVRQVTHDASVRTADPGPSGHSAVAIRCRGGHCDVVWVDLASGAVSLVAEGSTDRSYAHPRLSPDGTRILVSQNQRGTWRLLSMDTLGRGVRAVDPDDGVNRYDAEWVGADHVVTVSERGGIPNLADLDLGSLSEKPLTRVTGAAIAPATNPSDSSVLFLSLYAGGYDLRRIERSANLQAPPVLAALLRPVVPVAPSDAEGFPAQPVAASHSFGLGPRLFRWLPADQVSPDGEAPMIGLISSDVIGRSEALGRFAFGDSAAWRGESLDLTWRGFRPTVGVQLYRVERRAATGSTTPAVSIANSRFTGLEPWIDFADARESNQRGLHVAAAFGQLNPFGSGLGSIRRRLVSLRGAAAHEERGTDWELRQTFTFDGAATWMNASSLQTTAQSTRLILGLNLGEAGLLPLPLNGTLSAGEGSWSGSQTLAAYDWFTVGGLSPSIVDPAVYSQQISVPGLPTSIDYGHLFWSYRVASNVMGVAPYVYGVSLNHDVICPGSCALKTWQRVVGAEWSMSLPHVAIAGSPAVRALIGGGRSVDPPLQRKLRVYASVILDP